MSTNFLPDFNQFGMDSILDDVPEGEESIIIPLALGKDIAFNFLNGTFDTSSSQSKTWVRLADESRALNQWVTVALLTPRGRYLIYPDDFGSNLHTLVGLGLPLSALAAEVPQMIEEALLVHDRIEEVANVNLWQEGELLVVSFQVVLDDDARLDYQANLTF